MDLPEIQIVRHARAKSLKLRVSIDRIRLTVPMRCSQVQIHDFIVQSKPWMETTWQKLIERYNLEQQHQNTDTFPTHLSLCGFGIINIVAIDTAQLFYFDQDQATLFIDASRLRCGLRAFILACAQQYLPHVMARLSLRTGLEYSGLKLRMAKTRWGSCTHEKGIMLNALLMLTTADLIEYVVIHELSHTLHFNHSQEFWQCVEKHCPDFRQRQKALKQWQMPIWLNKTE